MQNINPNQHQMPKSVNNTYENWAVMIYEKIKKNKKVYHEVQTENHNILRGCFS